MEFHDNPLDNFHCWILELFEDKKMNYDFGTGGIVYKPVHLMWQCGENEY